MTKKLEELNAHECRYPVGKESQTPYTFCGEKVQEGQPYCAEHKALCTRVIKK